MNLKNLLKKSLLVGAALLAGTSGAWAISVETFGATDYSTAFNTLYSEAISIPANNTATITFTNYSKKEGTFQNWAIALSNDVAHLASGYLEYVYLRPDNYGWNPSFNTNNSKTWYVSLTNNYGDWGTGNVNFYNIMHESSVTLTVVRKGSLVNIHAAITPKAGGEYYQDFTMFCGTGTQTIRAYMTCEGAYLKNLNSSVTTTTGAATDAGWATCKVDNDFSNAISEGAVAGAVNSMTLSSVAASNTSGAGFALGYDTKLTDVLRVGNGTGTVTIPAIQRAGYGESSKRDIVYMSFDLYYGKNNNTFTGFDVLDEDGTRIGGFYLDSYNNKLNGTGYDDFGIGGTANINALGASSTNNDALYTTANKTTFFLIFDYSSGTMQARLFSKNGTKWETEATPMKTTAKPIASFVLKSNNSNEGRRSWFDNLTINTVRGDYSISNVSYTVKFVDGDGTTVKNDDTSRDAMPGTEISALATSADQTTFYNDGDIANNNTAEFPAATNKYVYKSVSAVKSSSDDTEIDELVDGAIVTIVYDKYNKYDYAMKQKLGDAAATDLHTGTLWGDQTVTYYYPICVKDEGSYYVTVANGSNPKFGQVISSTNANPIISYMLDDRIVYYVESENMGGSRYKDNQVPSLASNGTAYCAAASDGSYQVTNWEGLAAGNYDIEVGMGSRGYAVSPEPQLKSGASAEATATLATIDVPASNHRVKTYFNQPIAAGDQLYFYNDNGSNPSKWALDYVILRSLPTTVSVSTATGKEFATFNSDYALNFSGVSDVTAYTAVVKGDGSSVTFTKVTGAVPAHTGLLIRAATLGGSADVPVVPSASPVTNEFVAVTADAGVDITTGFVLATKGGEQGFYRANSTSGTHLAKGKAYLPATGAGARMTMVFEDETTGINSVQGSGLKVNGSEAVYNLQGQRVAAPQKGLYIINGKKVIVK